MALIQSLISDLDIQFHMQGGMAVILVDGAGALPTVPSEYLHGNGV
jgi:hypothetical protein